MPSDEGAGRTPAPKSFYVIRGLLKREAVSALYDMLRPVHSYTRENTQSGFQLAAYPECLLHLAPIAATASEMLGEPCGILPTQSSCRLQSPTGEMSLGFHQDFDALKLKANDLRGMTFWLPLHDIEANSPTLEIADNVQGIFNHHRDDCGYSVMEEQNRNKGPYTVLKISAGDCAVFGPYAIHRTYIPRGADRERLSLDVRCKPLSISR